jgi:hypothetical protein
MGKVLELRENRFKSLNHSIRDLYLKMALHGLDNRREPMAPLSEEALVERVIFYRKMCGEFVNRFRTGRFLTPFHVSELIGWTEEKYLSFERGEIAFSDDEFKAICKFLGAEKEMSVFLANMEEVFSKGASDSNSESTSNLEALGVSLKPVPQDDK